MPSFEDILSFSLSFVILGFTFVLLTKLRQGDIFKERLKDLMQYKEQLLHGEVDEAKIYSSDREQRFPRLKEIVAKIQRSGKEEQESIRRIFIKAGLKSNNASFLYGLYKIISVFFFAGCMVFIAFFLTDWRMLYKILVTLLGALMGSYAVDVILRTLVERRQDRIRKAFPEALDLMVICTEAGLSLTATIQRVAREMAQVCPDLGYELALLSIELNVLSDRRKALQNFSDRMDSPYFRSIISNIQQAEQYGTPIAQTMRAVAEEFRQDRLIEAEEKAAKLPALMSLPMMLFIFPCIYIVILGPAILTVMATFASK
ncbi:MAG: type II secretion system F family protein [Proteobacteria bacterium]|nr:type II secretion system F family protein [Pseudomonadota bacterium]